MVDTGGRAERVDIRPLAAHEVAALKCVLAAGFLAKHAARYASPSAWPLPRLIGKESLVDEQAMRNVVLIAFEYSYKHDDWVNPLADALAGVTAAEAAWRPGPDLKGIWDMVLHMAVWNDNIVERMRSGEDIGPSEHGWPSLPAVPDEAAWEEAQRRLWNSLAGLHTYIETNSLDALAGSPHGLGDLFCRFIHNAHHIGSISNMRELRAAQRLLEK